MKKNISFLILSLFTVALTYSQSKSEQILPVIDIDKMIGQMLITGVKGTKIEQDKELIKTIKDGKVGGIILFEKNINKTAPKLELIRLIDSLKTASNQFPLIVSIDQEGGKVNRLKTKYGFPKSVTASYLGQVDNIDTTLFYAKQTARTLRELGINVNFSPVLDLCKNKANPVIAKYGRCYSENAEMVIKHASKTVEGHRAHNIKTVVKHFPGHGSSHADSHIGMADVTNYWGEDELVPFKGMIDDSMCDAVMTAHIINYKLNPDSLPATLSSIVNDSLLRKKLGFDGVIFSDDMQMKAISKNYGLKNAVYLAINSGVDVLMFSNNISGVGEQTIDKVHTIIKELISEGKITEERIKQSFERILQFKEGII